MPRPDIILVNGASSAGKSTFCAALQAACPEPFLRIGFDDFIWLAPARYRGDAATPQQTVRDAFAREGVVMRDTARPGEPPCVVAEFGPVFRRLIDAMAPAVRALVDAGNPVIFDHVLHDRAMWESCCTAFGGLDVLRVGVHCPLAVLEDRERARGDRVLGRARGLFGVVHSFCEYAVTVDTSAMDLDACVARVRGAWEPGAG